jgi:hypothetical protein
MLRLASDADVHGDLIRGLRRRLPELDLVRAQDALPEGTADSEILAWAAAENRVWLVWKVLQHYNNKFMSYGENAENMILSMGFLSLRGLN